MSSQCAISSFVILSLISFSFGLGWRSSTANAQEFSVLHFTETSGFNHGTASASLAMFESLGATNNFSVVQDSNGSEFDSLSNLQNYAVVIFSNTSGDNILNATQRTNFEAYIQSGGSYMGIHAGSDTYRHSSANGGSTGTWDWYAENVAGCSVQTNPNHTSQNHNNDNTHMVPGHPVLEGIPNPWNRTEEYYYWENGFLDPSFTEILRVGQTGGESYDVARMTAHVKELQWGGRAFYTSLGHRSNNFSNDQDFIKLLENAVNWTAHPIAVAQLNEVSVFRGVNVGGALGEILDSDDADLIMQPGFTLNTTEAPVWLIFDGTAPAATSFFIESSAGTPGLAATVDAWNWSTSSFEEIGAEPESFGNDSVVDFSINASHIDPDGSVRGRVGWRRTGFTINFPWQVAIDQVGWNQ